MRRIVLGIAAAISSFAPAAVQADDQLIADFIRGKLQIEQKQGNLRGFNVDMRVDRGTVWFDGHTATAEQEMLILKTAQQAGHLGVVQVVDDIEIQGSGQSAAARPASYRMGGQQQPERMIPEIVSAPAQSNRGAVQTPVGVPARRMPEAQQVQFQQQPPMQMQAGYGQQPAARVARSASPQDYVAPMVTGEVYGAPMDGMMGGEIISGGEPMAFASCGGSCGAPPMAGGPVGGGYGGSAPMAAGYAGAGMPSEAPNLPGYAWPGYAANPNYGAVSYPKQYSAAAWPYIGPFYPYPQVPLGWRKVSLEWDDGWWQLDFHDK